MTLFASPSAFRLEQLSECISQIEQMTVKVEGLAEEE
jgi:hypothetical protein